MNWYLDVLKKYAVFDGRARRKEYWMFALFNVIVVVLLGVIEGVVGTAGILVTIYSLGVLVPSVGVAIRRLHDTDRSGWWLLIGLVPVIGGLVLLYFLVLDSNSAENQFGANPKAA